ncbi:uncharacterized protein LOC111299737 isoform X3 [Durio zibethinus]|uniref:Uncharacterized protein LOC111299737 isoform X3 n=1 Tax=Durio zibethinus TaxID=66656 RepID=A0A6P5ZDK7_DURZI|nr:uncharacterized protein LOC111299737 isoform X3 [Durio zibethinus]
MASSIPFTSTPPSNFPCFHHKNSFPWFPVSVPCQNPTYSSTSSLLPLCFAAKSQTGGPVKKRSSSAAGNKKRRKGKSGHGDDNLKKLSLRDVEIVEETAYDNEALAFSSTTTSRSLIYHPPSLPKPPAGFVVDDNGRVLMASNKRIATIVSDEEVEAILPTAAYALAKIHMHLVHSGFCYTARGGFCFSEDNIFDFRTDDGQDIDGLPTEGIEITCFHLDGAHYMIYTPSDPLLFVAVKDQNGMLQVADDDLLEDPAIMSAIDEETEFNALVEEEAALLESLLGER